ncbi:DUF2742 domain-containing protein [Actinomycetospora chibensis]|uniref:DUF2742 domain-containing protein n=1 Tax=Actinomycetospora chibensis TaxID=663606 RepID=A0ABV9RFH6_9PSEU|nr:DUF2742 domain-containing protein [Actinomycetospora chibensis]
MSVAEQAVAIDAPAWCPAAVPSAMEWPEALEEVHRWCSEAMTAGPLPVFGSPEWCALDDGRTKTQAAVRAALAWWAEQWSRADAAARAHVEASYAISGATDWRRVATDLRARRANGSARIPRQCDQASL